MIPFHPHQHRALVAFLRLDRFKGMSADAAFSLFDLVDAVHELTREPVKRASSSMKELASVRFLTRSAAERLTRSKKLTADAGYVELSDEEASAFPAGVPGFPNRLRREWFDRAWEEARG